MLWETLKHSGQRMHSTGKVRYGHYPGLCTSRYTETGALEAHCLTVGKKQQSPLAQGRIWRAEASPTWTTLPSAEKEVTCTSTACSL